MYGASVARETRGLDLEEDAVLQYTRWMAGYVTSGMMIERKLASGGIGRER